MQAQQDAGVHARIANLLGGLLTMQAPHLHGQMHGHGLHGHGQHHAGGGAAAAGVVSITDLSRACRRAFRDNLCRYGSGSTGCQYRERQSIPRHMHAALTPPYACMLLYEWAILEHACMLLLLLLLLRVHASMSACAAHYAATLLRCIFTFARSRAWMGLACMHAGWWRSYVAWCACNDGP